MATVLLVDDDPGARDTLRRSLTDLGHTVDTSVTALEAIHRVTTHPPDVIVLEPVRLPPLDGTSVLSALRATTDAPVIIATAHDDETEMVRLLRAGADDYLVKPFSGEHLDARIMTVLRRTRRAAPADHPPGTVLESGGLRIELGARRACLDGVPLALTRKEFDLLAYLVARPGQVVSRRELLAEVWHQPCVGADQTIDVHLYWLRRKLGETAAAPRLLLTVRGVGIRYSGPSAA
jgi:DNA-binding response OmpR family regulator